MKFVIEMDLPEEEQLKICIVSAIKKRDDKDTITVDQIKDFEIGDMVLPSDLTNMLLGSCLGELLRDQKIIMIRIE